MREAILQQVGKDLEGFRSINGYELDYANIVKGQIPTLDSCNNFPTVCYDLGLDVSENTGEAFNNNEITTPLYLWIYVTAHNDSENIVDIREQAIADIIKFVMNDSSISGYNTDEHKVLKLNIAHSDAINGYEKVNGWNYQLNHNTLYKEQISEILMTVNITYPNFSESTLNYNY